jgi:2-oxoglutarate dehydrogenase E2 component (dihydrolipoamide succinyltransferase)
VTTEVKVPQLPESVTDATLVAWHKKAGDRVRRDENLVDLETDKVVLEVPAPSDGVLKEIKIDDGATVTGGQVLALLEPGAPAPSENAEPQTDAPAPAPAPDGAAAQEPGSADQASAERESEDAGSRKAGPAARKLLEEHGLAASEVAGSGRDGRITKGDVLAHLEQQAPEPSRSEVRAPQSAKPAGGSGPRGEQRVAMTRLRARIAQRLLEAQQSAAMLTTFNEVDMSAIMALRSRYQEAFTARYQVKLGYMSFFVKAAIEALRKFPLLNASVDDNNIVYHEYFDIGVAVSTDRGLVVPVLRDAETLGFAQIEQAIGDFGQRARSGGLTIEELTGGTFTITNGGIFGSLLSTPILNPPQSGILGMHKIQERPVAVHGSVEVRPMMYLALTYDHRIVDGREAVQFLVAIKDQLEDPARLILQI